MTQTPEIQQAINDILESPEFRDSKRYQQLLKYLVDETLKGNPPKEITLGREFFEKDSTFDPKEDPTVRVYINNLRKKIEHYYLTDTKPHFYRLEIPKGHYLVKFIESIPSDVPKPKKNYYKQTTIALAVSVLILTIALITSLSKNSASPLANTENPIWADFVKPNSKPTLVVLGDFFFLFERRTDGQLGNFVRDLRVNSIEDFRQQARTDLTFGEKFVQSDITFLRPSASWGLAEILPFLQNSPNGYSLKLASEFKAEDFKSNNVVFIGSFKSLFDLQKVLHVFGIKYSLTPASISMLGKNNDTTTFSPHEVQGGKYEKDVSVVAKGIGPNGNCVLLMLGFADTGVLEATRAATDLKMFERLKNDYIKGTPTSPFNFQLVVESEGLSQAIFKANIKYFNLH